MKPNVTVPGRAAAVAPRARGRDGRFSAPDDDPGEGYAPFTRALESLGERVEKVEAIVEAIRIELNELVERVDGGDE
jgi:hypothetical protein